MNERTDLAVRWRRQGSGAAGESNRWLRLKCLWHGESCCATVKASLTRLKGNFLWSKGIFSDRRLQIVTSPRWRHSSTAVACFFHRGDTFPSPRWRNFFYLSNVHNGRIERLLKSVIKTFHLQREGISAVSISFADPCQGKNKTFLLSKTNNFLLKIDINLQVVAQSTGFALGHDIFDGGHLFIRSSKALWQSLVLVDIPDYLA